MSEQYDEDFLSVLYKIEKEVFDRVLSNHPELSHMCADDVEDLINQIDELTVTTCVEIVTKSLLYGAEYNITPRVREYAHEKLMSPENSKEL